MNEQKYYSIDDLVERYRGKISRNTLAQWRSQKKGPPFSKIGATIMYPVDELERWEARGNE